MKNVLKQKQGQNVNGNNMKNYLKRLNWYGALLVLVMSGGAAFSRDQDPSLLTSFYVWLIFGVPFAFIFLFVGMESKKK